MKHYTCTECRTESEQPKTCTNAECLKEGQDMTSCECTDGQHAGENDEVYYAR